MVILLPKNKTLTNTLRTTSHGNQERAPLPSQQQWNGRMRKTTTPAPGPLAPRPPSHCKRLSCRYTGTKPTFQQQAGLQPCTHPLVPPSSSLRPLPWPQAQPQARADQQGQPPSPSHTGPTQNPSPPNTDEMELTEPTPMPILTTAAAQILGLTELVK